MQKSANPAICETGISSDGASKISNSFKDRRGGKPSTTELQTLKNRHLMGTETKKRERVKGCTKERKHPKKPSVVLSGGDVGETIWVIKRGLAKVYSIKEK